MGRNDVELLFQNSLQQDVNNNDKSMRQIKKAKKIKSKKGLIW